ncbi:MAG: hypothetical protein HY746_07665 [Elusimicrobia bacterium]|nr:hypothetical protein [Elusimicrobiota bacterium]
MKKAIIAVIAITIISNIVNAFELENINAKDVVKMSQETQTVVPEPTESITINNETKVAAPITAPVYLKSPAFAELLINSLNIKPKLVTMGGGQSYVYEVGAGLTCYKSFYTDMPLPNQPHKARYSCAINPAGGWKFMGMESYGSGDNREFSLALYKTLKVKEINEEGVKIKSLALEQPDQDGGTERNLLSCINPGPEAEAMGFRPACQLINAL